MPSIAASVQSTKAVHSPAPWAVGVPTDVQHDYPERYVSGSVNVMDCNGATVATVYGGHKHPTHRASVSFQQRDVNAVLVVAAPDMLKALHEVAGNCYVLENLGDSVAICSCCREMEGEPHDADCTMQFVLAAIAKAEGR